MKVYRYTPEDVGMAEFPSGEMRLAGTEATLNPADADVFVLPCMMYHLTVEQIITLLYLRGNETRHAFLNVAERPGMLLGFPGMFFRCDCTKRVLEKDPTTISWPWPVEDLQAWAMPPADGFQHDVVFQGWSSTPLTDMVCSAVQQSKLKVHIEKHVSFYGWKDQGDEATKQLRDSFLKTLHRSRLSLVPRSLPEGVVRYRFYEAMSMGRVPVHFCDLCVLPFSDRINYGLCSLHIPEGEVANTGRILEDWLSSHTDDDIIKMGQYGRAMYERWLHRDKWNGLFTEVVKEKLGL